MDFFLNRIRTRQALQTLLNLEDQLPLDHAALLLALEDQPSLDLKGALQQLDDIAARLEPKLQEDSPAPERVRTICDFLFEEEGFQGNADDYYNPRNSFLHMVLERRLGIPLSLSIIVIEVCKRCRVSANGIGMPGHFLTRIVLEGEEFIIDSFNGGAMLSREDCRRIFNGIYQGAMAFNDEMLKPVSKREMLYRLLGNLKSIYINKNEFARALSAIERMMMILPGSLIDVRDRGLVSYQLGFQHRAYKDLSDYLDQSPDTSENREPVSQLVERLRMQISN